MQTTLPTWISHFEALLASRGPKARFFVRETGPTFADFMVFDTVNAASALRPAVLESAPLLAAFLRRMADRPNIRRYHESKAGPQNRNGKTAFFDNEGAK